MMGENTSACTSAHIIEELRVHISMKMSQTAWGSHQVNFESNLLKTLNGRRRAMPATDTREKKEHNEPEKR